MENFKNWKKTAIALVTGVMLAGSLNVPAMAHGHHGSHHSSTYTGTYCSYHHTTHKRASSCKYYCTKHHKTHKNGKCHY